MIAITSVTMVYHDCYAAGRVPPYAILLAFSGMRAALAAGSAFNDRVAECHAAAAQLLAHLGRSGEPHLLGQVSHEEYGNHKAVLGADLCLLVCSTNDSAWRPYLGEARYLLCFTNRLITPHVASWVVLGRSHAQFQNVFAVLPVMRCKLPWPGDTGPARRAEHFFTETARVAQGARLWEAGDIAAFGALMNASGRSSAQNYEVIVLL